MSPFLCLLSFLFFRFPSSHSMSNETFGDNSTLSGQSLGQILCLNWRLSTTDFCRNLTRMAARESTPMPTSMSSTSFRPTILPTNIAEEAVSATLKALLSVGLSFMAYLGMVLYLKFRVGMSWPRAFAVGMRRGHLCPLHVHLHLAPEQQDAFEMATMSAGNV